MKGIDASNGQIESDRWSFLLAQIRAETGDHYPAFRKSLTPKYGLVWRDIALAYIALGATLWLASWTDYTLLGAVVGALGVGCCVAYLQLFIHEAAHYNIAASKPMNDLLANMFIAWLVGTSVAAYRRTHFDHHRFLGRDEDAERSYAYRLTWRFIGEMVSGVHAFRIFLGRAQVQTTARKNKAVGGRSVIMPLICGVTVHLILLSFLTRQGAWASAVAWIVGIAVIFPVLATIRPLLEHRSTDTDATILLGSGDAVTRLFDDGVFARVMGGAGFNRHLLHHWEPQVSYTRLAELESYLQKTSVGAIMDARRTTYFRAFIDIMEHDRDR